MEKRYYGINETKAEPLVYRQGKAVFTCNGLPVTYPQKVVDESSGAYKFFEAEELEGSVRGEEVTDDTYSTIEMHVKSGDWFPEINSKIWFPNAVIIDE